MSYYRPAADVKVQVNHIYSKEENSFYYIDIKIKAKKSNIDNIKGMVLAGKLDVPGIGISNFFCEPYKSTVSRDRTSILNKFNLSACLKYAGTHAQIVDAIYRYQKYFQFFMLYDFCKLQVNIKLTNIFTYDNQKILCRK